jgi:hypothetical protein
MRTVQEVLGHSTIGMTERYSHLAPNAKHEAVALLDERTPAPPADRSRPHDGHGPPADAQVAEK